MEEKLSWKKSSPQNANLFTVNNAQQDISLASNDHWILAAAMEKRRLARFRQSLARPAKDRQTGLIH